jgi:hypothetical protein
MHRVVRSQEGLSLTHCRFSMHGDVVYLAILDSAWPRCSSLTRLCPDDDGVVDALEVITLRNYTIGCWPGNKERAVRPSPIVAVVVI